MDLYLCIQVNPMFRLIVAPMQRCLSLSLSLSLYISFSTPTWALAVFPVSRSLSLPPRTELITIFTVCSRA